MIIDSHCHLDMDSLESNLKDVIKNAHKVNVKYLLTICTDDKSFKKILNILNNYNKVFGTYGIHPHEAKNYSSLKVEDIKKNVLKTEKIIGIGESGLDFYYQNTDKNTQKKIFIKHINACQELSKTLIVHSRSAEESTFDILSSEIKNKNFKFIMHCFTGSKSFAHKLLDIGSYISASGIITFKKSNDLRETIKSVPLDRLLVETDSPYLSPEPVRGNKNEPKNIIHTVKYIADIKNDSVECIAENTSKNFCKVFNLKNLS